MITYISIILLSFTSPNCITWEDEHYIIRINNNVKEVLILYSNTLIPPINAWKAPLPVLMQYICHARPRLPRDTQIRLCMDTNKLVTDRIILDSETHELWIWLMKDRSPGFLLRAEAALYLILNRLFLNMGLKNKISEKTRIHFQDLLDSHYWR